MASRSRWALARGARTTWQRFRADAAALDRSVWTAWGGVLALGLALAVAIVAASVEAGRWFAEGAWAGWDEEALRDLVERGALSFDAGIWWESLGSSAVLIPLVVAATVMAARARRPLVALSFPVGYVGIKVLLYTARALWDRPRPAFVADGLAAPGLGAYPSGHTVNTLVIYGLLTWLWIERSESWAERAVAVVPLAALVGMVAWARLRLGAHWPTDIAAGVVVGLAWLLALVVALRVARRRADASLSPRTETTG